MTESRKKSNWPSVVLFISIICLATYVMMRNPSHKASFGTYDNGRVTEYDSIEIVQDTAAASDAKTRKPQTAKRRTPQAPERDLLSEEIPEELPR